MTADNVRWLLLGASPDLRQQILTTPQLQPHAGNRSSPIAAVALLNADVDHVAGLLTLRENQPFQILGTAAVLGALAANPIFSVLDPDRVARCVLRIGERFETDFGIALTLFSVPGKVALWQEDDSLVIGVETETTVGATIEAHGRVLHYVPSCAAVTDDLAARLSGADAVFFDGTTWTDDEMVRLGLSPKTAGRMGHVAMSGEAGSLTRLAGVPARHKIYVHINNTNPVLVDGSPERSQAQAAGWVIGRDGMTFQL